MERVGNDVAPTTAYLFRRGSHDVVWERCLHAVFFEHSHLAVMAA